MNAPRKIKPPPMLFKPPAHSWRRDAVNNRARLLKAAAVLFEERGVEGVCMSAIAKAAGVGHGTLYRNFADKAEICLALLDEQMRLFQDSVLAQLRDQMALQTPYLDQLAWFVTALAEFNTRHIPLLCAAQNHARLTNVENPAFAWQRLTVSRLLLRAQEAGEIAPTLDLALIADLVLTPMQPVAFHTLHQTYGYSAAQISEGIVTMLRRLVRSDD